MLTAVLALIEYVGEVYTNLPTYLYRISRSLEQPHCHYLIATVIITLLR